MERVRMLTVEGVEAGLSRAKHVGAIERWGYLFAPGGRSYQVVVCDPNGTKWRYEWDHAAAEAFVVGFDAGGFGGWE
jgi:hypothetical protein